MNQLFKNKIVNKNQNMLCLNGKNYNKNYKNIYNFNCKIVIVRVIFL